MSRYEKNPSNPLPEDVFSRSWNVGKRLTVSTAFSLMHKDVELVTRLTEYYGTTKSDVVRTAIRHLAAATGLDRDLK